MANEIRVWKSEFEQAGDAAYQVSLRKDDGTDDEILSARRTHQEAWESGRKQAAKRGLRLVDEIDGQVIDDPARY